MKVRHGCLLMNIPSHGFSINGLHILVKNGNIGVTENIFVFTFCV
jgi:hypothetical protein